jgi:hypothetical protein
MRTTFSRLTAKVIRSHNPRIKLKGFSREVRKLLYDLEDKEVVDETWRHHGPRFIPDAFFIDHKKEEIYVFEIEDSHPLTVDILKRILNFYWWLDSYYWKLRVFVLDRYGLNKREICLFSFFYADNSPD